MFPFDDVIKDNIGLYGIYFMSLTPFSEGEGNQACSLNCFTAETLGVLNILEEGLLLQVLN